MDQFNLIVTPEVSVQKSILHVSGKPVRGHQIINKLGQGKNGVVFLAKNRLLGRDEALKVWFPTIPGDRRDKLKQGLKEAMKLAQVNGKHAVQIFNATVENGAVVASMEYVVGETLRAHAERIKDISVLIAACYVYLNIIDETSTPETRHGDPHWNNVLVFETGDKHNEGFGMKLCDFGTSVFSGQDFSERRHWRIVEQTIMNVTKGFPSREWALATYDQLKKGMSPDMPESLRTGPLRDYLDCWRMHRFPPENMSVS